MASRLARNGYIHRFVDAILDARNHALARIAVFEGPAPFAHARNEHSGEGMIVARGELRKELIERLARPEDLFEFRGAAFEAGKRQSLVDDDRPGPKAGKQQEDQHRLYQRIGAPEQ